MAAAGAGARQAGVSEAAPYDHFADKDALLAVVAMSSTPPAT